MKNLRRRVWVYLPTVYREVGFEKAVKELKDMGFEELNLLICSSGGALFLSKVRPQTPEFKGKDIVTPFVKMARREGFKLHAWIVTLNFPCTEFSSKHREWYVVNRLGENCIDKSPYVSNYKWLCPSRHEVKDFVADFFLEVASSFDVDGVHFDYIRLPDIILPEGVRRQYRDVPRKEILKPQFDYCYCHSCRMKFMDEFGVDPLEISYEDPLYMKWFKWRADRITELVKYVYRKVKNYDSTIEVSAAVFATPSLAYKYVFQRWPEWNLDFYDPMIYHKYYNRDVEWIGEAVKEGVSAGVKLSAGILVDFMESLNELARGFRLAVKNGASGVTVFVYPPPREELKEWIKKACRLLKDRDS